MSLFFPKEIATHIFVRDGYICFEQTDTGNFIELTRHQFLEIYNRSKHLLEELENEASE